MVFKKLFSEEKAVTPVVGVMLMVVVTVILAAAVSSYASSMKTQDTAPQSVLKVSGSAADKFIALEHLGGDVLTKNAIDIEISQGSTGGYVQMSNVTFSPQSDYLRPGDAGKIKFDLKRSWQLGDPEDGSANTGPYEVCSFKGDRISLAVYTGTPFKMTIIDKNSGQTVYSTTVTMNP